MYCIENKMHVGAGGEGSAAAIAGTLGGVPDWIVAPLLRHAELSSSTEVESESEYMKMPCESIDTRGKAVKCLRVSRTLKKRKRTGSSIHEVAENSEDADDARFCSPFRNDRVLSSCTTLSFCDFLATNPPVVGMMHEYSQMSPEEDDFDPSDAAAGETAKLPRLSPATHGETTGSERHSLASCSLVNDCTMPTSL